MPEKKSPAQKKSNGSTKKATGDAGPPSASKGQAARPQSQRNLLLIGGAVVVGIVALFLFTRSKPADSMASFMPANTALYFHLDLNELTSTEMEEITKAFQEASGEEVVEGEPDAFQQEIGDALGLDYEELISPWLGDQLGAGFLDVGSGALSGDLDGKFIVVIESSDTGAANAFLDAMAYHRRSQGLPVLSINWGPWTNLGMAARFDREGRLALRGLGRIPPDQGLEILGRLIRQDSIRQAAEVGVMPINWRQWREFYPAVDQFPLFSALARDSEAGGSRQSRTPIRDALLALDASERRQWLETYIRKEVARVMQIDPDQFDGQRPLNTIGMDSLMGIELKNRVESDLGVVFPLAAFIQGPSISQVSAELLNLVTRHSSTSNPAQVAKASGSPIRELNLEEAEQLNESQPI